MNIHHDLEGIKLVAIDCAKRHGCNYNIILMNPAPGGKFDPEQGSTYEFVLDSYLKNHTSNGILLFRTDDLLKGAGTGNPA